MLSNFSQYAPQGLAPQIPGLQPGIYGNPWLGHELGQQGMGSQVPAWVGQINPFAPNPLAQSPFNSGVSALNPNLPGQGTVNPQIYNSVQMVPVLGQLAQQLAIQSAQTHQVAHQITIAIQHLAHQLGLQSLQGQYYGQNPLAGSIPGSYSGFNPQAQAWGANRPTTIQ
jgi:hypothetical protein